ncbi:hypothetical protein KIPE111705_45105 [Kibdelosporangium persicum]|uniref:hypothetical protein n=1 Tax=Kibdelosporangium persicum TaxID=2698649 RepID=UPI001563E56E|nr:hypothetical protein [Kibdelosporangium persicum]
MTMQRPDRSPMEVVRALRSKASCFTVLADVLDGVDETNAAMAREEAVQLGCRAAVVEQLSELYEDLGEQARQWSALTATLRGTP